MAEHVEHAPTEDQHALPRPTVWPMVMAAGITLFAAGIPTNIWVLIGGALLFALAVWGWVRDLVGPTPAAHPDQEPEEHRLTDDLGEKKIG